MLVGALKECFDGVDKTTKPFPPHRFWMMLKQRFTQFAATTPQGHPMQQDAEELFSELMMSMSGSLKQPTGLTDLGGASNLVDALFGLEVGDPAPPLGTARTLGDLRTRFNGWRAKGSIGV